MSSMELDLSDIFELERHGADTYIGESPPYHWGRIYGGLVVAQALWAASLTVREDHHAHSLHAYFVLGGDPAEPVRYEVDRVRNGRSFTTRQVIARQSGGNILTLSCSYQAEEHGPETQPAEFPAGVVGPDELDVRFDAGQLRCDVPTDNDPPGSLAWVKFPTALPDDPRIHACAITYLSDANPMSAVGASHPDGPISDEDWRTEYMSASLDHAMWFHRPVRADDWILFDMRGHGLVENRGLATGLAFDAAGIHTATIAQEGLLRTRKT